MIGSEVPIYLFLGVEHQDLAPEVAQALVLSCLLGAGFLSRRFQLYEDDVVQRHDAEPVWYADALRGYKLERNASTFFNPLYKVGLNFFFTHV